MPGPARAKLGGYVRDIDVRRGFAAPSPPHFKQDVESEVRPGELEQSQATRMQRLPLHGNSQQQPLYSYPIPTRPKPPRYRRALRNAVVDD